MCNFIQREYGCGHHRYIASRWCEVYSITHKRCPPEVTHFEWYVCPLPPSQPFPPGKTARQTTRHGMSLMQAIMLSKLTCPPSVDNLCGDCNAKNQPPVPWEDLIKRHRKHTAISL